MIWLYRFDQHVVYSYATAPVEFGLTSSTGWCCPRFVARGSLHMANREPAELFCRGWPVRHSFAPSAPPRRRAAGVHCVEESRHVTSRYACDSSVHGILTGRALDQLQFAALCLESPVNVNAVRVAAVTRYSTVLYSSLF
jgi:hypothetical protein